MARDRSKDCPKCGRLMEPGHPHDCKEHAPRHRFDCGRCKFSWSCGLLCACALRQPDPPPALAAERERQLTAWRKTLIR